MSCSAAAGGKQLSSGVQHGSPGCDDDVRVAVKESAERVSLDASVQSLAQVRDAAARTTPFEVTLTHPLGDPEVVDGAHDGSPVPSS